MYDYTKLCGEHVFLACQGRHSDSDDKLTATVWFARSFCQTAATYITVFCLSWCMYSEAVCESHWLILT